MCLSSSVVPNSGTHLPGLSSLGLGEGGGSLSPGGPWPLSVGARAAILAATDVSRSSSGSGKRKECSSSSSRRRQVLLRHCVSVLRVSDQQSTVCHEDPCKPLHIAAGVTLHSKEPDRGGRGVVWLSVGGNTC